MLWYLVEYYTRDNAEIRIAWIYAASRELAAARLTELPEFRDLIQMTTHSDVVELAANAFVLRKKW